MKNGTIAKLELSGTTIKVGVDVHEFPWFKSENDPEPNYMSVIEAKLLIAALQAAVGEVENP